MDRRVSRFSQRSLVGVTVALVFAAVAGVGLAQITSEPSSSTSAVITTTQPTGTPSASTTAEAGEQQPFSKGGQDITGTTGTTGTTGQQKVAVCHITGNGSSHTIDIAEAAVSAHVAHGDTEGACAAPTTTMKTKTKKPKHVHSTVHVRSSTHGSSSHATTHVPHSSSTHPPHTSHGNSAHMSHGNSGSSHGNGHNK